MSKMKYKLNEKQSKEYAVDFPLLEKQIKKRNLERDNSSSYFLDNYSFSPSVKDYLNTLDCHQEFFKLIESKQLDFESKIIIYLSAFEKIKVDSNDLITIREFFIENLVDKVEKYIKDKAAKDYEGFEIDLEKMIKDVGLLKSEVTKIVIVANGVI